MCAVSNTPLSAGICFDVEKLAQEIERSCKTVVFALLHGSAKAGIVCAGSDIDVALYLSEKHTLEMISAVSAAVGRIVPATECDVGVLNGAEPVYRFEALRGRLLFSRDEEAYLSFFSLT